MTDEQTTEDVEENERSFEIDLGEGDAPDATGGTEFGPTEQVLFQLCEVSEQAIIKKMGWPADSIDRALLMNIAFEVYDKRVEFVSTVAQGRKSKQAEIDPAKEAATIAQRICRKYVEQHEESIQEEEDDGGHIILKS